MEIDLDEPLPGDSTDTDDQGTPVVVTDPVEDPESETEAGTEPA